MNYGYGYPYYDPRYQPMRQSQARADSFPSDRFVKGLVIGAAAAYVLTNENIQRAAIKSAVQAWSTVQGGVEELKERFQDAEAELRMAQQEHGD
jgi:hypothetical protein